MGGNFGAGSGEEFSLQSETGADQTDGCDDLALGTANRCGDRGHPWFDCIGDTGDAVGEVSGEGLANCSTGSGYLSAQPTGVPKSVGSGRCGAIDREIGIAWFGQIGGFSGARGERI